MERTMSVAFRLVVLTNKRTIDESFDTLEDLAVRTHDLYESGVVSVEHVAGVSRDADEQ